MKEIRFHGRGGQGAVLASNILANAAFLEGRYVQAFLLIGAERRGAQEERRGTSAGGRRSAGAQGDGETAQ